MLFKTVGLTDCVISIFKALRIAYFKNFSDTYPNIFGVKFSFHTVCLADGHF